MKEKYEKLKIFKRKGKGLIAEEHDWVESEESSSDEEDVANLLLHVFKSYPRGLIKEFKLIDKGKSIAHYPQKATEVAKLNKITSKPLASQSSGSGSKISSNLHRPTPKLKIDIKPKKSE
ncbi:hypothetical protein L6452_09573 [Arctium lappa]|uniref:Uncharacterized protein n=1 Tax=Arctium lappa TaxID=4217 RepID=A0ACB9DKZ0_ARCLA|nr:hypothetical protein L6452_09573 [Arctium lappa]